MNLNIFSDLRKPGLVLGESLSLSTKINSVLEKYPYYKKSGNLFEERNWVLPNDYLVMEDKKEDATIAKPPLKEESKMEEQTSSQKEEKCGWGPDCHFCKAQKKDGEEQKQKPLPKPQAKRPNTLSMTKTRQQWEEEMEMLNTKYNLNCFSDSELDSESDEGEQYQYKHGYETLI